MGSPSCHCSRARYSAFALALFVTLLGSAWPQQELPDAREIVDRYVEAIGGADALASQPGRHLVGRFEVPAQGIGGDMEVYSAPPNRLRSNVELPGLGSVRVGFDGEVAWTINPAIGPMVLDGRMLDQMRQQADWQAATHPDSYVASMETIGKTEFEGHSSYKVKVVTRWDEEYFEYFDVESGLLVGSERTQASPMGDVPATTIISDYRQIGDLLVPMKTVQRMMGMEQVITFSEVEAVELGDSVFALPAEIQALVEEKSGKGSGSL